MKKFLVGVTIITLFGVAFSYDIFPWDSIMSFVGGILLGIVIFRPELIFKQKEEEQTTWVYCDCEHEMIGDKVSFVRDVYVDERNVVHYKCSKCGNESYFDFDYPAPILLPFNDNDDIIKRYQKLHCS